MSILGAVVAMQSTNISQEDAEISSEIDDATRVRNLTVFKQIALS